MRRLATDVRGVLVAKARKLNYILYDEKKFKFSQFVITCM